jgi:hypothetical protein
MEKYKNANKKYNNEKKLGIEGTEENISESEDRTEQWELPKVNNREKMN